LGLGSRRSTEGGEILRIDGDDEDEAGDGEKEGCDYKRMGERVCVRERESENGRMGE
jgi:hypothetical protein